GIAEVQAVRKPERAGSAHHEVPGRLADGDHRADVGIELAITDVTGEGDRETLLRALDAEHRGVRAGSDDRVAADERIILAVDPALRTEIRRGEQAEQGFVVVGRLGKRSDRELRIAGRLRLLGGATVERRLDR